MKNYYKYGVCGWLKLASEAPKFLKMKLLHEQSLLPLENSKRYQECFRESQKSRLSAQDFYYVASRVGFDYEKAHKIAADDILLRALQ